MLIRVSSLRRALSLMRGVDFGVVKGQSVATVQETLASFA